MPGLHTLTAPPPGLQSGGGRSPCPNAYFAISIDAAVDLLEAREYQDLQRGDRLTKALDEQQGFMNGFFDPTLRAALDLRIIVTPQAATPLSVALLGRVWGAEEREVAARAERLCGQVHASMPRHVTATPVPDATTVETLLAPFPGDTAVDSA